MDRDAPRPERNDILRKDYSFLFQRFFNFLENAPHDGMGIVVFDELEHSQCHILVDQMTRYFKLTENGRQRSSRVIPEPFFVHSDLTSAVQIADILAYVIQWGIRLPDMNRPMRPELAILADKVKTLRYLGLHEDGGTQHRLWGFKYIDDLRPSGR